MGHLRGSVGWFHGDDIVFGERFPSLDFGLAVGLAVGLVVGLAVGRWSWLAPGGSENFECRIVSFCISLNLYFFKSVFVSFWFYRFLVLRVSVIFFKERSEKIHHGDALSDCV